MPLNPDKDISNGQLMINPKTGQPYSDINAEREALKAEATTSDTKPFFSEEKFVTAISKFMAFIIAGTILMILFFLLFAPSVPGEYSSGFAKFLYLFVGLPLELIMIIIAGMIGYVIGMSSS